MTKKELLEAIEDIPEGKYKHPTTSYPSGENAQIAYRAKYDESII